MCLPFIPRSIEYRNTADCDFSDVSRKGGPGADGAEEGVPAVGDGRGMQKSAIERNEAAGAAAGEDVLNDGGFDGGGGVGVLGGVRQAHFGEWGGEMQKMENGWRVLQMMTEELC